MCKTNSNKHGVTRCESYRFVKVNGTMTKVHVQAADNAFKAAMTVKNSRRKEVDKELLVHGVTI